MKADFKKYDNAFVFRQALETRLKSIARAQSVPLDRLRRKITFDRFLARLFESDTTNQQWLLKGGYALELRFNYLARATKDIDFSMPYMKCPDENIIRELLQRAAKKDLFDWFQFFIGLPDRKLVIAAIEATFKRRNTHDIPTILEEPPEILKDSYAKMALDCGVEKKTMAVAFSFLQDYWMQLEGQFSPGRENNV